jgi:hypothetical protein
MANHASDYIKPHLLEAVKQHHVYDGQDRMTGHYVAMVDAEHGDNCQLTTYTYRTPTSTQVLGVKESLSTWDSSWDI